MIPTDEFRVQLCKNLRQIRLLADKLLFPILEEEGLTKLQMLALMEIEHGHVASLNQLRTSMGISQSNASALCKKMEQNGFLTRKRQAADERKVTLQLTEDGKQRLQHLQKRAAAFDPILSSIDPQKLQSILLGMDTALEVLQTLNQNNIEKEQ